MFIMDAPLLSSPFVLYIKCDKDYSPFATPANITGHRSIRSYHYRGHSLHCVLVFVVSAICTPIQGIIEIYTLHYQVKPQKVQ